MEKIKVARVAKPAAAHFSVTITTNEKQVEPCFAYQGSTTTILPRFSWNPHDFKVAVWKGTQALNLQLELIFTMLKIALQIEHILGAWNFGQVDCTWLLRIP